jgi:5-oxoprolinase (ATP-hydrolysing)
MTNTRLTDPEVIERRYPVRLHEFSIRRGSGGHGASRVAHGRESSPPLSKGEPGGSGAEQLEHRGGDGVIRRLEFLRPLRVSILSERRGEYAPFGLCGGAPGARGENTLQRAGSQTIEDLGGKVQITVAPGDVLTIATPGGGAFVVE